MNRSTRHARRAALPLLLAALASPAVARAQGSTAKVTAEALFEEGRRLVAAGKAAEACPKFADSERLDPSAGTLLNLASCYEKTNRPATAWETYREAASLAASTSRSDLVSAAERHADALAPQLPRVTVTASTKVDGLVVSLDGVAIVTDVALPVDPGEHAIDARAPSFAPWSTKVTIEAAAKTTPVTIPALTPAPAAPPPAPVAPAPASAPVPAPAATPAAQPAAAASTEAPSHGSAQKTIGIVVGGVGIVALGVGGAFALVAKSKYNDSLAQCPHDPNLCTADGVSQRDSARSMGNAATIAMALGGAALVGGVVLWATAPSDHGGAQSARLAIAPTLGGAVVRGAW